MMFGPGDGGNGVRKVGSGMGMGVGVGVGVGVDVGVCNGAGDASVCADTRDHDCEGGAGVPIDLTERRGSKGLERGEGLKGQRRTGKRKEKKRKVGKSLRKMGRWQAHDRKVAGGDSSLPRFVRWSKGYGRCGKAPTTTGTTATAVVVGDGPGDRVCVKDGRERSRGRGRGCRPGRGGGVLRVCTHGGKADGSITSRTADQFGREWRKGKVSSRMAVANPRGKRRTWETAMK